MAMRDYRLVETVVQQRLPHLVYSLIEPCLGKSCSGLESRVARSSCVLMVAPFAPTTLTVPTTTSEAAH